MRMLPGKLLENAHPEKFVVAVGIHLSLGYPLCEFPQKAFRAGDRFWIVRIHDDHVSHVVDTSTLHPKIDRRDPEPYNESAVKGTSLDGNHRSSLALPDAFSVSADVDAGLLVMRPTAFSSVRVNCGIEEGVLRLLGREASLHPRGVPTGR